MSEATLYELLERELHEQDETPADVTVVTISEGSGWRPGGSKQVDVADLKDIHGDTGYGGASFPNLHAWTDKRVYFKVVYDGSEHVSSVPREPDGEEVPGRYGGG